MNESEQNQDSTRMLDERNAIRFMPGMYIGGTDQRALHNVIWNLIENAIYEALAHEMGHVTVQIDQDNVVTVIDDGLGLAIETSDLFGLRYRISSKYRLNSVHQWGDPSYSIKISSALAEHFTIQSKCDGFLWEQRYIRGEAQGEPEQKRQLAINESSGTTVIFEPDGTIFNRTDSDYETLSLRIRELAFLHPSITFTFEDRRETGRHPLETYSYPNGLRDFVRYVNRDLIPLHEPIIIQRTLTLQPKADHPGYSVIIEAAIQYVDSLSALVISFINGYDTHEGGIHVEEILRALNRVIMSRIHLPKSANQLESDVSIGLTVVVNIWHPSPRFEGAIRARFISEDLDYEICPLISDALEQFATQNPVEMQAIVNHCEKEPIARYRRRYGHDRTITTPAD